MWVAAPSEIGTESPESSEQATLPDLSVSWRTTTSSRPSQVYGKSCPLLLDTVPVHPSALQESVVNVHLVGCCR